MKTVIKWLTFWTIVSITFILAAAYLFCYANGYRINWQAKRIQKTGMIMVESIPSGADVYINGKLRGQTPSRISFVLPGRHTVDLKRDGYQNWQQTVNVEAGYVIKLTAETVFAKPVAVEYKNERINYFESALKPKVVNSSEIWSDDGLITRFSSPVISTVWDSDRNNIAYQIGSEIRMISSDGLHDFSLVKLTSADPTLLYFKSHNELVIEQNGLQQLVQIRDKNSFLPSTVQYVNF